MLTNSKEYHDLEMKMASFLGIDINSIECVCNPLRRKKRKIKIWLIEISNSKNVLVKEFENGHLLRIN